MTELPPSTQPVTPSEPVVVLATAPKSTVSPKVWAATVASLGAALLAAVITAVLEDPSRLQFLPPWAQFLLVATLPTLAAFVGGYVKRDPIREVGVSATTGGTQHA